MKTLEHCKSRIARSYGFQDWPHFLNERPWGALYFPLTEAAELYGRYCRFVGYYQGKQHYNEQLEHRIFVVKNTLATIRRCAKSMQRKRFVKHIEEVVTRISL